MANYSITVINNYPASAAIDVARDAEIEIIVNRDLKEETLDGNLKVEKAGSIYTAINGIVTYGSRSIKFKPSSTLDASSTYRVTLIGDSFENASNDGIKDIFGNMMLGDFVFSFTTQAGVSLSAPTLTAPISNTSFTNTPTISWQTVADAVSYEIYLSTLSDFSSDLWHTTAPSGVTSVTSSELIEGVYFCRMRYTTSSGHSPWSSTVKFYVEADDSIDTTTYSFFEVEDTYPIDADANIDTSTTITITFSDDVDEDTVVVKVVELPNTTLSSSFTVTGNVISVTTILSENKSYSVTVKSVTASVGGDTLSEDYTFSFTSTYSPLYCDFNYVYDDIIDLLPGIKPHYVYQAIRDASEYAQGMVTAIEGLKTVLNVVDWTDVPYYIQQFVRYQAGLDLYQRFSLQKATGSGTLTQLGDFIVQDQGNRSLANVQAIMKERIKPWLDMIMGIGVTRGFATAKSVTKGENTDYPIYYDRTISSSSTSSSSS